MTPDHLFHPARSQPGCTQISVTHLCLSHVLFSSWNCTKSRNRRWAHGGAQLSGLALALRRCQEDKWTVCFCLAISLRHFSFLLAKLLFPHCRLPVSHSSTFHFSERQFACRISNNERCFSTSVLSEAQKKQDFTFTGTNSIGYGYIWQ